MFPLTGFHSIGIYTPLPDFGINKPFTNTRLPQILLQPLQNPPPGQESRRPRSQLPVRRHIRRLRNPRHTRQKARIRPLAEPPLRAQHTLPPPSNPRLLPLLRPSRRPSRQRPQQTKNAIHRPTTLILPLGRLGHAFREEESCAGFTCRVTSWSRGDGARSETIWS